MSDVQQAARELQQLVNGLASDGVRVRYRTSEGVIYIEGPALIEPVQMRAAGIPQALAVCRLVALGIGAGAWSMRRAMRRYLEVPEEPTGNNGETEEEREATPAPSLPA